jgi:ribosomal-protein-alanine N-acetyltransferase
MQTIEFRPMTQADIPAVMQVEKSAYAYPWTRGIFADCIRAGYDCWAALEQDRLIGHAVLSAAAGESHILNLTVERGRQGEGIGRQFLRHLVERARLLGAEIMLLEVRASNHGAIHLYETSGFNEIGCRKGYYPAPDGTEDALLFALQIQ